MLLVHSRAFWLFAAVSLLLTVLAGWARFRRATGRRPLPARIAPFLKWPPLVASGRSDATVLRLLGAGALLIGLALYPYAYTATPLPAPYLAVQFGSEGAVAQAVIGVVLWGPALWWMGETLVGAFRFGRQLSTGADSLEAAAGRRDPAALRALLAGDHWQLFSRMQTDLFWSGLVGGVAAILVLVARPEWSIRIAVWVVLVGILALVYLWPLVRLGRAVARGSSRVREHWEPRVLEARVRILSRSGPPRQAFSDELLHDGLEALPPAQIGAVLARESFKTAAALVGSILTFAGKLLSLG